MNIKNWKIGTRLGCAFALLLILLAASVWFGIASLRLLNEGTSTIVNDKYPKAALAYEVLDVVNRNARSMRNMLLWDKADEVEKELQNLQANKKENAANFEKLEALVKSTEGKALLHKVLAAKAAYGASQKIFLDLVDAGKKADATTWLLTQVRQDQRRYFDTVRDVIKYQNERVIEDGQLANETYLSTVKWLLGLAALALVLGAAVAVWITRSITLPLQQAVDVANTVASGDLTSDIDVQTTDETGRLLQALKDMNASLVRIVGTVRTGADSIAAASAQITSGNLDLSSRTEAQAGSLEETASSMEALMATVHQNADNASQANQLAISATEVAAQAGTVVRQVVGTMGAINDASRKIVDIISVIDGIAFQTNILALNAAVEAARAGEQGRGFAVVASEVRSLAHRSAAAAKEIKELIGNSVSKVEEGSKLVDEAGVTMERVAQSIRSVTDIMADISAASQEQTEGIAQINQAVTDLDAATQQNAALVEEAAAASQSLQDQSGNLTKAVSIFKLDGARVSAASVLASQRRFRIIGQSAESPAAMAPGVVDEAGSLHRRFN